MNHLVKKAQKLFLDSVKIRVQGGTGGEGLPHYGGVGGKGGDVYIQGARLETSLKQVANKAKGALLKAGDGMEARRASLVGEAGKDLIIKVPLGVTITDSEQQYIGDVNDAKEKIIVAYGGRGGDKFNDNQGFVGQRRILKLDLKLISDVVLVGFPNAGKSSLLRAVSRAAPKVADYPFTTLRPNLGVVTYPDYRSITFADLPGLVEGAHKNLGLGHEFLKHIVRSKLLLFVIDINHVDLGHSYARRSPIETLGILNREIELYDDTLLNKPAILAVSKMDSIQDSEQRFEQFKEDLQRLQRDPKSSTLEDYLRPTKMLEFEDVIPISSVQRLNTEKIKLVSREVIDKYAEYQRKQQDMVSSYQELLPSENNRII